MRAAAPPQPAPPHPNNRPVTPPPRLPPGLVTLNDMKAKQEALVKEREKQLAKREQSRELQL